MSAQRIEIDAGAPHGRLRLRNMQIEDVPRIAVIDARAYEFPWTPCLLYTSDAADE